MNTVVSVLQITPDSSLKLCETFDQRSFPFWCLNALWSILSRICNTQPLFHAFVPTCCFSLASSPSLVFSVSFSFPPALALSGSCWRADWSEPRWSHHVFISLYSPFTFFSHRKPIRVGHRLAVDGSNTHTDTHPLNPILCPLSLLCRPSPFHLDTLRFSMTELLKKGKCCSEWSIHCR